MAGLLTRLIVTCGLVTMKLMWYIPFCAPIRRRVEWLIERVADVDFSFQGRDFDWGMIPCKSALARGLCADRGREAYLGYPAPYVKLRFADGVYCFLGHFLRSRRPLVVSLVSKVDGRVCGELRKWNDLARRKSWMADFLTIVIGCQKNRGRTDFFNVLDTDRVSCVRHFGCRQDRKVIATFLVDSGIAGDLVYDTSSNEAEYKFGAMPERLFIIHNNTVTYVGDRGGHGLKGYDVQDLETHLERLAVPIKKALLGARARYSEGTKDSSYNASFKEDDPRHPCNLAHRPGVLLKNESVGSLLSVSSSPSLLLDIPSMTPQRGILKAPSNSPPSDEAPANKARKTGTKEVRLTLKFPNEDLCD